MGSAGSRAQARNPSGEHILALVRAIQMQEFGGPEVLRLVELPTPEPADGEVLIKVTRAGLNYADTHHRTNSYLAKATLPLIPGSEVAGVREDTGERVVALSGTGGYAEYATAPGALTFPIPDGVDEGTALALLIQGLTAWHLYPRRGAWGPASRWRSSPPPAASARSPSSSAGR